MYIYRHTIISVGGWVYLPLRNPLSRLKTSPFFYQRKENPSGVGCWGGGLEGVATLNWPEDSDLMKCRNFPTYPPPLRWHVCRVNFARKIIFELRIFLRKMLRNFPRNFWAFVLWVRKNPGKFPPNFPLNFPNFPAKNQKKFTDELLQERREKPPPPQKITYAKKFLRNNFRGDRDTFA